MENWRRWRGGGERWRQAFNVFRRLRSALGDMRDALGGGFERFAARVVSALLRERGEEYTVHVDAALFEDGFKEVDLLYPETLVAGGLRLGE